MTPLYALLILSASVTLTSSKNNTQVSVTLYYETLCPYCQDFIPNVLTPTFLDSYFGPLFKEINLIPFGIVDVVNSRAHKYDCQHGKAECQGNRFHSCAIKHIKDKKRLVNYISCLMKSVEVDSEENEDYPLDQCLDKVPVGLYAKILDCYHSEEGRKLFEENGRRSTNFFKTEVEFVPYVSFDNIRDDDLAEEAVDSLKKVICQLTGVQHSACSERSEGKEEEEY